jgi:hypothetical protein
MSEQLCIKLTKGNDVLHIPVNDERDVEVGLIALVDNVQVAAFEDRRVGQEWTVKLVEMSHHQVAALEEWDGWGQ